MSTRDPKHQALEDENGLKLNEHDLEEEQPPPNFKQAIYDSHSDTTTSSDGFDWFEDEEYKTAGAVYAGAKRGRRLWLAIMKLSRPVRVVLVTVLGASILITPLLVVNLRFHDTRVRTQVHVWCLWFTAIWITSCMTYLLVDLTPRLVLATTRLFSGKIERLKIQVELTMAVKAWLKLALSISWAWISLSVIRAIYQPIGSYWIIINRLMQVLFAAGIIFFIEKLALQFVAINFHQKALADRLAENRLGLKALDHLSNAQPVSPGKKVPNSRRDHRHPVSSEKVDHSSFTKQKEVETSNKSFPINDLDSSTTPSGRLFSRKDPKPKRRRNKMATVIVDQVGGAIGQVALKNSKFNKDFSGLHSARRLAKKLFSALSDVHPPKSHLVVEDFYPYFRSTVDAHEAFALFDKDGNGDISKPEMREAVQRIYRERKALIAGLKDVGSIVAKLDAVLLCVALVIITFIALLIFNRSNTVASLVPLATIVLGFSFIFGNSAQTLFGSLIFIFSTHVFDVGDLVMIDDQVLFVKEFGLFSTTFRRVDGQEIIAPNALLANTKLVHNLRRSKSMWETTTLTISYDTPMEIVEQLRGRITNYISSNSREWSGCALNIDKMDFQNAIHLIVAMEHRPNWQDWGGRWTRRTAFMRFLKTALEELDVHYTMPIQPVILPRGDPLPSNAPHLRSPTPGRAVDRASINDILGNAGFYQAGDNNRPSGATFRPGTVSFNTFA